jgi:hypothetical protein
VAAGAVTVAYRSEMADWFISEAPRAGLGHQTPLRRIVERTIGPEASSRIAKRFTIGRANIRRSMTADGRRAEAALEGVRDAFTGRQCVIIGNGPSLNDTDLSLLEGRHTFGLNRLYLIFDKLGFATEFHVVVNHLVVSQCAAELVAVPGRLFSTWPNRDLLREREDAVFLQPLSGPLFSTQANRGVWEGATVTYVALQLAFFMGFQEVLLVGVDHRFATKGAAHEQVATVSHDQDHFDPNYFGAGFRWQLPDLATSEFAYRLARRAYERAGRRVIDCTVDGALSVFPKGQLAASLRRA